MNGKDVGMLTPEQVRHTNEMDRILQEYRDIAHKLASELGTEIPGDSPSMFWMLPILSALSKKITNVERRLDNKGVLPDAEILRQHKD